MGRVLRACAMVVLALALPFGGHAQQSDPGALRAAAEAGNAQAQFKLAETLRTGTGVPQNYARAARWYQAAADQGNPAALNGLAGLYAAGLGVDRDPARALELVTQAAESGTAEYVFNLGSLLETGVGTDPDPARAAALYQQAADLGWQEAAVSLALLYQEGKGVAQDIPRAVALYQGPAEAGHPRAQNNLGLIYTRGEGGVAQDYALAVEWYEKAAERGLAVAMTNLGVMYENGFGVDPDEERAKELYRLAAKVSAGGAGDGAGPLLVYDDRLLPPDPARVQDYLTAARAGDPLAQFMLGYLQADAAQSARDYRAAAFWFRQSAERGMSAAMANLGLLHFEGKGALQDYVEGYKWLTLAAVGGQPAIAAARDAVAGRMTAAQINTANELAGTAWQETPLLRVGAGQ